MKLLITGYPGWLVNRFLETRDQYPTQFDSIRCLTLDSTGLPVPAGVEIVLGDLTRPETLKAAVSGVDVVLHAAGVLHTKIPDFYRINRDGTKNLLEACVQGGVKKFIFISSNAAQGFCGDPAKPLSEADPCRPSCDYGRSKQQAEDAVNAYFRSGKIDTAIFRPAMFYGPPVPKRHLDIYKKILKGWFPVFGTGRYVRSLTYIDNLVQAIHLALDQKELKGNTYAIIDQEIPTLMDIIQTMSKELGVEVKIVYLPKWMAVMAEKFDLLLSKLGIYWMLPHIVGEAHKHIAYTIEKAKRELGYHPTVNYREGYRRAIQWCREHELISYKSTERNHEHK